MAVGEERVHPSAGGVRDAATVVVLRRVDGVLEAFMVRRASKSAFMPDAVVFPGGAFAPEDGPVNDPGTAARAARRECFEETGIDLGGCELAWFDTWKTPSGESPRRFLARFFAVVVPLELARTGGHDGHETSDGFWASTGTLLSGAHDLPPPTLAIVGLLDRFGLDRLHDDDDEALAQPILPKVIPGSDPLEIVMPHDARYPALAGDGHPAPTRTNRYPRSFRREGGRWRAFA